jgi:hypothetical protein
MEPHKGLDSRFPGFFQFPGDGPGGEYSQTQTQAAETALIASRCLDSLESADRRDLGPAPLPQCATTAAGDP